VGRTAPAGPREKVSEDGLFEVTFPVPATFPEETEEDGQS
jgi:hypothetical protein